MAQRLAPGTAPAAATPGSSTTPSGKPAPSTPGPRRKPALSSRAARRCFICGGCKAVMDASGKVISRVPCEAWAKQAETDERAESGLGDFPTQDYRVQFMLVNCCSGFRVRALWHSVSVRPRASDPGDSIS